MDPFYMALNCFRRRKYEKCADICTDLLQKNSYDEAVWSLKAQALTAAVYVDDVEAEEEGIAEAFLGDESTMASAARPGTSLRVPTGSAPPGSSQASQNLGITQAYRPMSSSGRPLSGVVRPESRSGHSGSIQQALSAPRSAHTARPASSASGRYVRLGTASLLSQPDGPLVNVARMDLQAYAKKTGVANVLFRYLLYHQNDVQHALDLAAAATQAACFKDWWWKVQLGRCYYRLGLLREAEQQLKSALRHQSTVEATLMLANVYLRLDRPLAALDTYKESLESFPAEASLLTAQARVQEMLGEGAASVRLYREVLQQDAMQVEALACTAAHFFYADQPEVALRFYRRLLHMGVHTARVFGNAGLCCFYAQQYDLAIRCLERALVLVQEGAEGENGDRVTLADVWYGVSHVAVALGDAPLASQALLLALSAQHDHTEALNDLGVLEARRGRLDSARALFQASAATQPGPRPHSYQPHFNLALLADKTGDLCSAYASVQSALQAFPTHSHSRQLMTRLQKHFSAL